MSLLFLPPSGPAPPYLVRKQQHQPRSGKTEKEPKESEWKAHNDIAERGYYGFYWNNNAIDQPTNAVEGKTGEGLLGLQQTPNPSGAAEARASATSSWERRRRQSREQPSGPHSLRSVGRSPWDYFSSRARCMFDSARPESHLAAAAAPTNDCLSAASSSLEHVWQEGGRRNLNQFTVCHPLRRALFQETRNPFRPLKGLGRIEVLSRDRD